MFDLWLCLRRGNGNSDAGIGPNTRWEDLPDGWKCPWCGAGKGAFREKETEPKKEAEPKPASQEALETPDDEGAVCDGDERYLLEFKSWL